MKLSLRWIFDHIHGTWEDVDIKSLVEKFNETTAEIEEWYKISLDLNQFSLAEVRKRQSGQIVAHSSEWKQDFNLEMRDDVSENRWFLVTKDGSSIRWANSIDLGARKLMLLPALYVEPREHSGGWKKWFETTDYILEVDNKSVTHRPDLWGHRGFAREIAAILNKTMIPLDDFLVKKEIENFTDFSPAEKGSPFSVSVETKNCNRFASLFINQIESEPSLFWMTTRLSRVDSRCIDTIVDTTNYVMLDLSQPMHAFDAEKLVCNAIMVRQARNKAELILLDGQKITLTDQNIIIADGEIPISLAGIMGGASSAIGSETKKILLESANFNPTAIRRSSSDHKIRTEASARFEKGLDPNQNVDAILRFLYLIQDAQISCNTADAIMSIGPRVESMGVEVTHQFIEERLGTNVALTFVVDTLEKLDFHVDVFEEEDGAYYYVVAPTFRSFKDISLPEDIVEEVGRFFGYGNIPLELPSMQLKPSDLHTINRVHLIKHVLAYTLEMHEVENYSFFDELLLRELQWEPKETVNVKNPVSENWQRLVTSLVPHLLKSVEQNPDYDQLRFFEWARVWQQEATMAEKKSLGGIFFDRKKPIDFYSAKELLSKLFQSLDLPVLYEQISKPAYPWFTPYQSAYITHQGKKVGTLGIGSTQFLERFCEGYAFIFELNGDFLLNYKAPVKRFKPLPKYPLVSRDISILVPLSVTTSELLNIIKEANDHIISVTLVDFFTKKEWENQKALTFRFVLQHETKTMTTGEIDTISLSVNKALEKAGAKIR